MKILNIKIKNENEIIRNIEFLENDIFYVYGNVKKPRDNQKTSNSIGKTLALKMCDYIFGCKVDSKISKSVIATYSIVAEILHDNRKHKVERNLNSKVIYLDGKEMQLLEYCSFFNINRNFYTRFIQLNSKGSLLGYNKTAIQSDYVDFLNLLNLNELANRVDNYYNLKLKIDSLEKTKKELLDLIGITDERVSEEIYINGKKINEVSNIITETNKSIKNLEMGADTAKLQENYEYINNQLKKVQVEISKLIIEDKNLKKFISESNNNKISLNLVKKMFEKANYQVPDMVYKKIEEVESFYKSVIEDRVKNIYIRLDEIDTLLTQKHLQKNECVEELDSIGRKIADDGIYQTALNTINENTELFSKLKYDQGQLNQIKKISNELSMLSNDIVNKHNELKEIIEANNERLVEYREFVYNIVKNIYNQKVTAYFDIHSSDYRKGAIPIHIDLKISGETGEGISEVKKNIIDILLFRYTKMSDILILDSSCFNGIDPRQVSGLLAAIKQICVENNKQAIISINKYQITNDYISNINENNCLNLSEDEKLLYISF